MYCLIDPNEEILGADDAFLEAIKCDSFEALRSAIGSGSIVISLQPQKLLVTSVLNYSFETKTQLLHSSSGPLMMLKCKKIASEAPLASVSDDTDEDILDLYINTALDLEKSLNSKDITIKTDAVETLAHLSAMLDLDEVHQIIAGVIDLNGDAQKAQIAKFYQALSKLGKKENSSTIAAPQESTSAPDLSKAKATKEIAVDLEKQTEPPVSTETKAFTAQPIAIEEIQPASISYDSALAAETLGIPKDMVDEFVGDFMEQAVQQNQKLLQSYQEGEIEQIHKTSSFLFGAANNLLIEELAAAIKPLTDLKNLDDFKMAFENYISAFKALS